jgi:integrase
MKHSIRIAPERRKDKAGQIRTKDVPLFVDIRFGGMRLFYFTGYRADVEKFDTSTQRMKKNSTGREGSRKVQYNEINDRLNRIAAALTLHFQNTDSTSRPEVIDVLDKETKKSKRPVPLLEKTDFFSMFEHYINVTNVSAIRKRNIQSIVNHWKAYEADRNITISFEAITPDLLRDFERYLKAGSPQYKSRKEGGTPPKGINTVHKTLAMTRAFMNFARLELKRQGIEVKYPFGQGGYPIPPEVYGTPIYITSDERDKLFNAELTSDRLRRVRDIFVFQCLIGARVGDLCKLTKANVQDGAITYIPRKTMNSKPENIYIPLHPKAIEIINRYDMPDGSLFPFITDQRYNDYLKELFREVGINRIVTRLNPLTGEPEQVKICDIVSSKMARSTFVGNLFGKVDQNIIKSMSGHTKDSKAFSRYYDVSKDLQKDAISKL